MLLAVFCAFLCAPATLAQSVPTGFQEYFVLGNEQHLWDMLTRVQTGEGGGGFASGMNSVVSATASADNQVVTYDHWEDGLEADIFNPVQATTLVIGDGNNANGRACDFTTDPRIFPCNGTNDDLLFAGSFINFNSDQGLGCAAPPADLNCSVPVNPRVVTDIRYDGGDFLTSSGGPLSLVHPQDPLSPFIGGATEIIPRQAVAAATSYTIPIGEDIYAGDNTVTEPFKYVDLNLVAFDDNTQVNIVSPGAGNVAFTLNRGQHYSSRGFIDSAAAAGIVVNAGTRISTTAPIGGLIFTGGDGTFATRFYTLLPDILHSTDYIITAPGDDPVPQGSRPLNLYIFNPDPLNALAVTATDSVGTTIINIPSSSQVDYFTGTGRFVPANSTVRLTSDRRFWGVSAYSHQSPANDWGHSWLAREFVTSTYTVPFAPGVNNPGFESLLAQRIANDPACTIPPAGPGLCDPLNRSPVFVSATADNTEIQIDFDNDGTFDIIDLDGDDFPDPAPGPDPTLYVINALQALRVYDHNDYDNTGTLVVGSKPIAVSYGEDTDQATGPDPIQDTGYAIYPINQLFLDPTLVIEKSVDTPVVPLAGGLVTYTLEVTSFGFGPISSLQIYDLLDLALATTDYVPGSTLITYPDLSQSTADPALSTDVGSGRPRLDWTLSPTTLNANQTITVQYSVQIPAAAARRVTNEAHAEGSFGGSTFSPLDTAEVVQADLTLTKAVTDDGTPEAGEVLTYTLNVTNNGVAAETNVVITDLIPTNTTFVPASVTTSGPFTGAYNAGQNAVVWTAANFPVGGPHTLTFQVMVNPGTVSGTVIPNLASFESTQTPLFPSNEVETTLVGPFLVVSKTGPALLHPNETATFEITVNNTGAGSATNVRIVDFFPTNASYLSESMQFRKNVDPLASVTDAADADEGTEFVDRLELLVPSLGSGQSITFRFQVQVNPGTDGQTVNNQATITSDEVAPTFTNLVQIPIVGNADITGHVFLDLDGNGVQNGAEPDLPNLDVVVTETPTDYGCAPATVTDDAYDGSIGSMACCNIVVPTTNYGPTPTITDLDVELSLTTSFVGDVTVKLVSPTNQILTLLNRPGDPAPDDGSDFPDGDSSNWNGDVITFDDDGGDPSAELMGNTLGGGGNVCADDGVCAHVPAPDTAGGLANLAGYDGSDPRGTWQLCVGDSFAGAATTFLTGNLSVMSTDTLTFTQTVTTDANGDYIATVANTQVSVDVQESDPDFPPGATLTTANDPQNLTAIVGGTVAATPVGYQPPPITFTKTSDAVLNQVVPGQTITYTLTITNNSGINQTGIIVTDPLPTGTSAVPGSTVVAIPAVAPGGDPPNLVVLGDGYSLAPAGVMTITFQVVVDDPLAGGVTQITNTATVDTDQQGPQNASVIDTVLRLAVTVEPNNAGFAVPGGSVTYSHVVTNTGQEPDSYNLTLDSELGYTVELIDPATGTVIATDTDGDGVWDGGVTINTGVLAVGASRNYRVRVNVPLGTAIGTEETTTLTATSTTSATISAFATDETTVVDSLDLGPVALIPDHSGVVVAGDSIAYTHAVINNTGAADTFDLTAFPTLPGWTSTIYNDSNGDGVYSPGIDVAISNTLLLADGQLQTIFVVVDSPGGALPGDTDVVHLTAISQTDSDLFDAATDTTTILPATTHDLSGGGTVLVDPSDTAIFPGTIKNLTDAADRFDFTITASPFFGLDGLNHPTQLWVDTNADGVPDTLAAEDTNGDGTWDTITPGFDTDADSAPDVLVAAGAELAYELRRPVDSMQLAYRDPITLTATSQATGEADSVTTTNLLAAVTHAMVAGLEVYTVGSQVVLEWRTTLEHGTAGFLVERQTAGGTLQSLHRGILPALSKAAAGGTYRFADPSASAGRTFTYVLREMEIDGRSRFLARREVTIDFQALANPLGIVPASGFSSEAHRPPAARPGSQTVGQAAAPAAADGDAPERLRLRVQEPGLYFVSAASIAETLGHSTSEVEGLISQGKLRLHQGDESAPGVDPCPSTPSQPGEIFSDGFESGDLCAWSATFGVPTSLDLAWLAAPEADGIYFYGQGIDSIYTDDAIYWLEEGAAVQMAEVPAGTVNPVTGQNFTEVRHFEEESLPVTSVIEDPDSDFWFWSFVAVVPEIGTAVDTITVNLPTPGKAAVATSANLVLHLQAETADDEIAEDHSAVVSLNGTQIGTTSWDGSTAHTVSLNFSQSLLQDGDNTLEIKAPAESGIASEIFYLDAVDLAYQRTYQALDDQLTAASGGHEVLTLEGFSRDDISVFDLTQIEQPRRVTDPRIDSEGGSFQVSFNSSPNSSYLALPLSAATPLIPEPDEASNLRDSGNRADYLVIPAAGLEAAAETLATHRQGQGLETMVVRLQDVYDEFNRGVVSPWALRDFIEHTATWATPPRFVVLAGDSSFDFKDRLGHGGNLLPAPMTSTPDGLFPSDHRTFDLSGEDGVPEIAVGRLPVRSNEELAQYVAKLVAYEAGLATSESWNQHTVWIADAVDEGGEFINDSELLIGPLPNDLSVERIYVDELGAETARQEILDTLDDGALLVNFLGHANLLQMGNGAGLLRSSDVAGLNNGARLPVLSAMTCALGRFDRVFFDTLSEQLVLAPNGGVIALWAPTGFAFNEDGLMLGSGFLPLTLDGPAATLGEAIRATLGAYLEEAEEPRPHVPFTYTLLGDPAIRLRP